MSALRGGTASVTLALTASRAVGTFWFTAVSLAAGASRTRVVTSGVFDVTFSDPNYRMRSNFTFRTRPVLSCMPVTLPPASRVNSTVAKPRKTSP